MPIGSGVCQGREMPPLSPGQPGGVVGVGPCWGQPVSGDEL